MIRIEGAHAAATVYTVSDDAHAIDDYARAQIQMICDTEACSGSRIRVMPDVHAGKVGPIGLTMTVGDKVLPALVGNDIGCGVSAVEFEVKRGIDFAKLDKVVYSSVLPIKEGSFKTGDDAESSEASALLTCLRSVSHVQTERAVRALGTLGGGNHFIELGRVGHNRLMLAVHSGSRILGAQVYEWYMRQGREKFRSSGVDVPYEMTWLNGSLLDDYLEDMRIVCRFAELNRRALLRKIMRGMKWRRRSDVSTISCMHNYIDREGIMRKGAVSAKKDERVLIPINMKEGMLYCVGRGNSDWNCSAPHGAGRVLKRTDVKNQHTLSEFKKEMLGVWSSSVSAATLDEAPFAYRSINQIREAIGESVEVIGVIKPLYNFKAKGE